MPRISGSSCQERVDGISAARKAIFRQNCPKPPLPLFSFFSSYSMFIRRWQPSQRCHPICAKNRAGAVPSASTARWTSGDPVRVGRFGACDEDDETDVAVSVLGGVGTARFDEHVLCLPQRFGL